MSPGKNVFYYAPNPYLICKVHIILPMIMGDDISFSGPRSLEETETKSLPSSIFYIPDFIDASEEKLLLDKIRNAPMTKWTNLTHRRLQSYPSKLTANNTLLASALPSWLANPIVPRLLSLQWGESSDDAVPKHVFSSSPHRAPNHVLINEYEPGQGIMPHEDGDAYFPVVATVSLGASIVLDVYAKTEEGHREGKSCFRILQEPRSLLITTDNMYSGYLHGIAEATVDEDLRAETIANWDQLGCVEHIHQGSLERATRTSLTFRDVWNTRSANSIFRTR